MRNSRRLGFRLGIVFVFFAIVTLGVMGVMTYISQMNIYREQCEENVKNVSNYIESLMSADGENFKLYREYYLEHFTEVDIPMDVTEYESYELEYNRLLQEKHPGRTLGVDIDFEDLDDEVKKAYFRYSHIYWILTYERAREDFGLPYTYFIVPDEKTETVMYMIDGQRSSRADHKILLEKYPEAKPYEHEQGEEEEYMYLGETYYDPIDRHTVLWNTWLTGEVQSGAESWSNEWGDTYAYYMPLVMDGKKLGLVVSEINMVDVDNGILNNTFRQMLLVGAILLACFIAMIIFLNRMFVSRIAKLEAYVVRYSSDKDGAIADEIEKDITGKDEIGNLSKKFANMIREIEAQIGYLLMANKELADTRGSMAKMSYLARTDALTGIRNRTAYDDEKGRVEVELKNGFTEFGIAMIDLNSLKYVNDTYGHTHGNEAIRRLCNIVCSVFEHSPVFRIGGDEFVVILRNEDYFERDELVERFQKEMNAIGSKGDAMPWECISAAIGIAIYEEGRDGSVDDVFKRADSNMYECKKKMKASR